MMKPNSIQKQNYLSSFYELIALGIGFLSMLFIYPLKDDVYGLIQFLINSGLILVPIVSFGLNTAIINFYPKVNQKTDYRPDLLNFSLIISLLLSIVISGLIVLGYLLFEMVFLQNKSSSHLLVEYALYILLIAIAMSQVRLLNAYLSTFSKIAIPTFIKEIGLRIVVPIIVYLSFLGHIDLKQAALFTAIFFVLNWIVLIVYGIFNRLYSFQIRKQLFSFFKLKSFFNYSFITSLSSIGSYLAFRIDLIMVASILGLTWNGIYAKILIISMVLDIPLKVLTNTTSPIIANAWSEKNLHLLRKIYKRTSLQLFTGGIILFNLIWFSLDELFQISSNPESFSYGREIFLLLGIGKLINLFFGLNDPMINYSKYYKANFVFIFVLAISNVLLNIFLINKYGVTGAALATCLSLILFNVMKFLFIQSKIKISPFSLASLKVLFSGSLVFLVMYYFPEIHAPLFSIGLKSISIISIMFILIHVFKLKPELF